MDCLEFIKQSTKGLQREKYAVLAKTCENISFRLVLNLLLTL